MAILHNVVEFETNLRDDNNAPVRLHVSQPTGFDKLAIQQAAEKEYPMFDVEPYRKPIPHSAIEGDTFIDKDDIGYKQAMVTLSRQRHDYILDQLLDLFVDIAPPHTREEVIAALEPAIARRAKVIDVDGTAWYVVLKHGLLSETEFAQIGKIFNERLPLEESEVRDGMRIFRPIVPGSDGD